MRHAVCLLALLAAAPAGADEPEARAALALARARLALDVPAEPAPVVKPDPPPNPPGIGTETIDDAVARATRTGAPLMVWVRYKYRDAERAVEDAIHAHTDVSWWGVEGPAVVVWVPRGGGYGTKTVIGGDDCSVNALRGAARGAAPVVSTAAPRSANAGSPVWPSPVGGNTPTAQPIFAPQPAMFSGVPRAYAPPVRRGG